MVNINLPGEVFFDSGNKSKQDEVQRRPSPTNSKLSFIRSSIGRNNLVTIINSLVEEHRKSREPGPIALTERNWRCRLVGTMRTM
jgi:hypothetical protein